VLGVPSLAEAVALLNEFSPPAPCPNGHAAGDLHALHLRGVPGQATAAGSTEAALRAHRALFIGPPGSGKTTRAKRLTSFY
jgi:predicted ATPase with chaperone activity